MRVPAAGLVIFGLAAVAAGCNGSSGPGPLQALAESGPTGTPIGDPDPPAQDPVDQSPQASAQSVSVVGSTSLLIALAGSDPDGQAITGWDWTAPGHGSLASTAAGVVSYTPTVGHVGPDAFTFRVEANGLWSAPATVSIDVVEPVTVDAVSPAAGPDAGGTVVTLTGTGFTGVTAVTFAGQPVSSFTIDSSTQLTCVAPVGSIGRATVAVTRSIATGTLADGYLYTGWRASITVSESTGTQTEAVCAISSSGVFHLAWRDTRNDGGDIYYRRSLDGGLTWIDERCFDQATPGTDQIKPALAVSGDLVVLAWIDTWAYQVWVTRSEDGGASWSVEQVQPIVSYMESITLAASGQTVLLGWDDGFVTFHSQSTDGGSTWSPSSLLDIATYPSLAISEGVAVIAYLDHSHRTRRRRSVNAGLSYGGASLAGSQFGSYGPSVALDGQFGVLTWDGSGLVWVQRTINAGANWSFTQILGAGAPARSASVGGSSAVAGWESGGTGWLRRSDDSGATWAPDFAVTDQVQAQGLALALGRSGNLVAVLGTWEEMGVTVNHIRVRVGYELAP